MAFFTPCYTNAPKARRRRQAWLGLLVCLFTLHARAGITIRSVETTLKDKVYLLNAQVEYHFSEATLEALQNGVPLLLLIDIEVEQERNWWLNKTVASLEQGYLLLYHALTENYLVTNLNSSAQNNFRSLSGALHALGRINNLPLIDANLVAPDTRYTVKLRVHLDIESLPAPMRPLAYLSSDWKLQSDWYSWPLQR